MSYHRRYKLKDDRFGLLALTLREKAGLTQTEVANALGVSERTIRHWEGGTAFPTADNMKKLIELYLRHGAFVTGQERDEANAFWEQAAQSSSHHRALFSDVWFDALLERHHRSADHSDPIQAPALSPPSLLQHPADWGEAMDVTAFYGREQELATLSQWVLRDRCRLVILLGMGGNGKTTLSVRIAQQVAPHFAFVFWRSLRNAPVLEDVLADCIQTLSEQLHPTLPQNRESSISLLIELLQNRRCLLVLDNVDTLLQAGSFESRYREEYEGYHLLFQRVAETAHQSCLLLTSREMLGELEPLEGSQSPVRALKVFGLGLAALQQVLKDKDLFGTPEAWGILVEHYAGNPLALKIASATVREVFGGNIDAFLHDGPVILHTVRQLLDYQFDRLSPLERDVMFWLAIEREVVPLTELSSDLIDAVSRRELLAALKSLRWRCLLERTEQGAFFTLQEVVLEYMSERLVEQVCDEIIGGSFTLLIKYTLMKAQNNDFIRDSQVRLIVQPVLRRLLAHFGSEQDLEQHLLLLVQKLRNMPYATHGYGGGNIVNLLACLRGHIKKADFSHLMIRQAYLQGIEAQDASFAGSDVTDSLFLDPMESIASMVLSPDGNYLAVGSFSGQIRVWRVADGKLLLAFTGHIRMVWALAFNPDSTLLASGGYDRSVKLWEIVGKDSGQCLKMMQGHDNWVRSVAFSPDGSLLVTCGMDATVRLWDVREGTCLRILHGHTGPVWAVAFSPDGSLLVTSGDDETVRLWDVREGTCLRVLHGHTCEIMAVAFHPKGDLFASGGEDGRINIWGVRSGRLLTTLQLHTTRAMSIAFNPEGTMLASGSYDGGVEVWKIERESSPHRIRTLQGHLTWVSAVAFGPGGQLASVSYGGKVKLWDAESGKCLRTFQGYSSVICSVAFSPDGSLLVHGDDTGMLKVYELGKEDSRSCLRTFQGHTGRIWTVICSPDGKTFASGGDDQSIKLWEVDSGYCLRTFHGHTAVIWSVAFSPDGSLLASGDNNGEIKLWEVGSGRCLKTLRSGANPVGALIFSAEGNTLISSNNDEEVSVCELVSGYCHKSSHGRGLVNWTGAMALGRDGKLLATGTKDHIVDLRHVEEQGRTRRLQTFAQHGGLVWSVAFSSDGSRLASGDDNGTVIVWETQTGNCLHILRSERPYERMNIRGTKGLTLAQKASLEALGAIEAGGEPSF
jgi:WD40 repeat protein/transcriptional regulator with XRE-family HTH domain